MEFTFRAVNGFCPSCKAFGRIWYIQEKCISNNTYEYALMSKELKERPVYRFKNHAEIAKWLNKDEKEWKYDELTTDFLIHQYTVSDYTDMALIERDDIQYRFDKKKNTLTELPQSRRETGWHEKYNDCLKVAKAILQKMYEEQTGEQLTLLNNGLVEE